MLLEGSGCGYLPMERENLAATMEVNTPGDLKESFNVNSREAQNKWPDLVDFKATCIDYFDRMVKLAFIIMRIFALALNLPTDYFDEYITPPNAVLRLLNYPALEGSPLPQQLRSGEHTDYGTLTIVRPDSSGLQVYNRSAQWIDVKAPIDSFVLLFTIFWSYVIFEFLNMKLYVVLVCTFHSILDSFANGLIDSVSQLDLSFRENELK
ncbi:unnamed protein product [Rotaria sp. Silwood2]|nr:unnamed protein product [Rotaria sp. Silwood2]CAF4296085.1 unnamed protein product [Rotaria sp. Silwood2]